MRYATFNVLSDAYISYGNYDHVDPELLKPGARLAHITRQIHELHADVVGIQEADRDLVEVFEGDTNWQSLWTPKGRNKPDGCLTLIKHGIKIADHQSRQYDDGTGHVFQITHVGDVAIANTHIKWAPEDAGVHAGVHQARELLSALDHDKTAVILADCNGHPRGRVQTVVKEAGFTSVSGELPTTTFNRQPVAFDVLAVKGLQGKLVTSQYDVRIIPHEQCASDHLPLVANIADK